MGGGFGPVPGSIDQFKTPPAWLVTRDHAGETPTDQARQSGCGSSGDGIPAALLLFPRLSARHCTERQGKNHG